MINRDIRQWRVGEALHGDGRLVKVGRLVAKGYWVMWIRRIATNIAHNREFAIAGIVLEEIFGHELWYGLVKVDAIDEDLVRLVRHG